MLIFFRFVAHVTEMSEENAITIFNHADVVTGCASKFIRNIGKGKGIFCCWEIQYLFSELQIQGKRFMELRIEKIGGMKNKKDPKIPKPLI